MKNVKSGTHNPKVVGSNPSSATNSVTVVDTISTTVIFCFLLFCRHFLRKIWDFQNIFDRELTAPPHFAAAGCSPKHGFAEIAIVIRYKRYLTPVPHRGKRNESAYVSLVCDKVAELKGVAPERVAAVTTENARRMFATAGAVRGDS